MLVSFSLNNKPREFLICASFLNEAFKALKRSLAEISAQRRHCLRHGALSPRWRSKGRGWSLRPEECQCQREKIFRVPNLRKY
ncbi:MAG: hypothetical protein QOH31_5270 [Verrucomicrobiota bacterium]|jgi:hypothetical protein